MEKNLSSLPTSAATPSAGQNPAPVPGAAAEPASKAPQKATVRPNPEPNAAAPDTEQRFIDIEMALSNLERTVEDLNDVIIRQGRDIAFLQKQNRFLTEALRNAQSTVKPLEEETPPPHY